jgi:hypothetical protein
MDRECGAGEDWGADSPLSAGADEDVEAGVWFNCLRICAGSAGAITCARAGKIAKPASARIPASGRQNRI